MSENNLKKILIAEDEKMYSQALVLKLTNAGFNVETVLNGEDAINLIHKEHNFDLLLCDLVMPKMNGFELLEEIKKENIKLPVIVISNLGQADDQKTVKLLGAIDFLIKSNVSVAEILLKVQNFFNSKSEQ